LSALAETQARIASITKLRTVVSAMRGMAAANVQQAREALESFHAYASVVGDGLARASQLMDPRTGLAPARRGGPMARVIFSAEHGFAGAFAARLLDAAAPTADERLFVLGSRGIALCEQRGRRLDWSAPMASHPAGVPATARAVAEALYARFVDEGLCGAEVVWARPAGSADFTVERRTLLPFDFSSLRPSQSGSPPLANLDPAHLVERLVGEHVFAELALDALESFVSENAARLATMESARVNIDDKLTLLSAQERSQRQDEITAEVQDVVAGALASQGAP
jgi:F-type H+-transporting ATPase subunit gamma